MATSGLSLVGLLPDPEQVLRHLRGDCIPAVGGQSDAALLAEWEIAREKAGPAFPDAGMAHPQPLAERFQPYIDELRNQPWAKEVLGRWEGSSTFQVVEIEPLISVQLVVDTDKAASFTWAMQPPGQTEMLETCLPKVDPEVEYETTPVTSGSSSVLIKCNRSDFQIIEFGVFGVRSQLALVGARVRVSLPFVQVIRVRGKCYLANGYHRVFAARLAGATHVPCVFRDLPDTESPALVEGKADFPESLLTSDNPPTMAHFTHGRAHNVSLRARSRVIHVSWHQYLVPEE